VPVWPFYEHGVLRFIVGPRIDVSGGKDSYKEVLAVAGRFFKKAVRRDPSGWRRILTFLDELDE
jgi:hypothetical protein